MQAATSADRSSRTALTFFAAFNPQFRTNNYLTQTFRKAVEGKIKTPFYSGKLSWVVNNNNTVTFSTFGDFTKEEGHLFAGSGFADNLGVFCWNARDRRPQLCGTTELEHHARTGSESSRSAFTSSGTTSFPMRRGG